MTEKLFHIRSFHASPGMNLLSPGVYERNTSLDVGLEPTIAALSFARLCQGLCADFVISQQIPFVLFVPVRLAVEGKPCQGGNERGERGQRLLYLSGVQAYSGIQHDFCRVFYM